MSAEPSSLIGIVKHLDRATLETISQPFIVAFMTEQLNPKPTDRILEIGTGSGYQAAILSRLVAEVYTIEIIEPLAKRAEADLRRLGFLNVKVLAAMVTRAGRSMRRSTP